ncbi:hypothetical protein [Clostridium sp. CCUG 7971]|uniref:hypothetical protein n=1 Tax=Clostridium sp. CCUG 7971 TaxID=2811414 RepID=UPI001ABA8A1A|nr:hypothetical protein [Clostridium sp. CCUG 7971]MBO3444969.1 hypothetical protein [Clostridium sp. CCUG 7971]
MENFDQYFEKLNFEEVEPNRILNPEEVDGELASANDFTENSIEVCNHLRNSKTALYFGVNKSGSNINVRSSAGTNNSIVAKMMVHESFCFTGMRSYPSDGYEWHQIEILNPSGKWITGWYRGMNGVGYWKNNPYRKSGSRQYYLVKQTTNAYTPGQQFMTTLEPGDQVWCDSQANSGKSGSSQHDWMLFNGFRFKGGFEMSIYQYSVGQDYERISYAYVDTQMKHGASHIVGNW